MAHYGLNVLEFTFLVWTGSLAAGFLGALTGLGGGVVLVPLLTIFFHVDLRYAIGASLVSVIATSSGSAAAYVKEGFSNIRIGMFLEIATTLGALLGAFLTAHVPASAIAVIFGLMLIYSAYVARRTRPRTETPEPPDSLATRLKMNGSFPDTSGIREYNVYRVPAGFGIMFGAGALSGLLGIGSGALKVVAMDQAMKIPFKVSTTTSNFMIGVTAAASAGVYLSRGYIDPTLAMPVMLGVLIGSLMGTRVLVRTKTKSLRLVFSAVIVLLGIEMLLKGLTGKI
ncbi:MAG TPA: sulfite exporter TauE/SafE family protein [Terriglobales bacterium]|nr:sulfite exporter TauE/SafE family protein [Terriglobales bacterium]